MMHSIRVVIGGEPVSLHSDQPEEVVEKLAGYLDQKIRDTGGGPYVDKYRVLALAAMRITGEMLEFKTKLEENEKTWNDMLAQTKTLTDNLDRALAPSG